MVHCYGMSVYCYVPHEVMRNLILLGLVFVHSIPASILRQLTHFSIELGLLLPTCLGRTV